MSFHKQEKENKKNFTNHQLEEHVKACIIHETCSKCVHLLIHVVTLLKQFIQLCLKGGKS